MIFGDSPIRPEEILQFIKSENSKNSRAAWEGEWPLMRLYKAERLYLSD